MRALFDFLVEEGLISRAEAERIRREEGEEGAGICYNLIKLKMATSPKLFSFVEEKLGLLFSIPDDVPPDPGLLELIPANIAHFYKIVPIRLEGDTLTLAASAVSSSQLLPALEEITGCRVKVLITHPAALNRALDRYYSSKVDSGVVEGNAGERVFVLKDEEKQVRPVNPHMLDESSAPADWLRTILAEAVMKRSRLVHLRPHGDEVRVYFVKEGESYVEFRLTPQLFQSVATFIDFLTGVAVPEAAVPQEKRVKIKINERLVNLQISWLHHPTGRSVTFELYDEKSFEQFFQTLHDPKYGEDALIRKLLQQKKGLLLLSATPASQRKLVLYSVLEEAVRQNETVYAIEESTFYSLPGVQQISTGGASQKVFSRMLEAALRQHPDVLAIDAVRDAAGMELAMLSCSRCLVLAVMTAADLFSALRWLCDSGFRSALRARIIPAIMQTTSVERLCKYCRKEYALTDEQIAGYGLDGYRDTVFYTNEGCQFCKGAGVFQEEPLCAVAQLEEAILHLLDQPGARQTITTLVNRRARKAQQPTPSFPTLLQKGMTLAAEGRVDIKDVLSKCAFLV